MTQPPTSIDHSEICNRLRTVSDNLRLAGERGDTERLLALEHKLKNCVIEVMGVFDIAAVEYDTVLKNLEYACESFRQASQSMQTHRDQLVKRVNKDRHLRLVYAK